MGKAKVRERREDARQAQKKALEKAGVKLKDNLVFPEYWAKRKHLLNAGLLKELQETADREPVVTDEFGSYKPGTFLFKACIVTVTVEDGLWMIHIFSQAMPITLPIIQEVRDRYIPDYCMMVQFYPSRAERGTLMGIQLCEMPGSIQEDDADGIETAQEVSDQQEDNDQAKEVKE